MFFCWKLIISTPDTHMRCSASSCCTPSRQPLSPVPRSIFMNINTCQCGLGTPLAFFFGREFQMVGGPLRSLGLSGLVRRAAGLPRGAPSARKPGQLRVPSQMLSTRVAGFTLCGAGPVAMPLALSNWQPAPCRRVAGCPEMAKAVPWPMPVPHV